jgi:hypothetical protein
VTGTGFPDDVNIELDLFDGTTSTPLTQRAQSRIVTAGTVTVDANGFFKTRFIVPPLPGGANVHPTYAQAPAITASPASATVGTTITVTGTGFPDDVNIELDLFDGTTSTPLTQRAQSRIVAPGTVRADANGFFKTRFIVPTLPGGTYTLRAKNAADGTILATTSFTIEPRIRLLNPALTALVTSGFSRTYAPDSGTAVRISLDGWKPDETVVIGGLPLITPAGAPVTTLTVGSTGSLTTTTVHVDFVSGGVKTLTVVGPLSGTKTFTFTVKPKIAIFNTQTDATKFSVQSAALTSVFLEGYGFPAGTIDGNTITVAGVTGAHAPISVGASGRFGAPSTRAVVSFTTPLPLGPTSLVAAGTTFNFENGNIEPPSGLPRGALIISFLQLLGGTAVIKLDRASYSPLLDIIHVFGYGFGSGTTVTLSSTAFGHNLPATATSDTNGALFAVASDVLGENAFGTYKVSATAPGFTVGDASFSIEPYIEVSSPVPAVADAGIPVTVTGQRFKFGPPGEAVTVTIAGVLFGTTTVGSDGAWSVTPPTGLPPVPFGTQTITATSATVTRTTTITIRTKVITPIPDAAPGETVSFASGKITGLKASTAYQITLGAHTGAPVLAEFTSDARGMSPAVSFTMPTAITETHIIDVREKATGVSAIYGNLRLTGVNNEQYTNLFIFAMTTLTLSPSRGGVGTEVTFTASNLRPGKDYTISTTPTIFTTVPFTATAGGTIPAGTKATVQPTPTTEEIGTSITVLLKNAAGDTVGSATFVLFATATLDKTEVNPGDVVTITAKGLMAPPATYAVYVGFVSSANPGILVGSIVPDPSGTGSTTFIVPDGLTTGTHKVQLVRDGLPRLLSPPSFTIKAAVALFDSATFKASAKTDKPSYRVGEEFKVSFLLKTTTGAARFDYVVTVKDPDGRVLYPISAATGISVDTTGTTITVTYAVPTGAKTGTWTASIVILQAGAVVDVAVITFTVT